jgi:DNA polymerase III subunit delta
VKANRAQMERALTDCAAGKPSAYKLFLLYGSDEAGSAQLAKSFAQQQGAEAERIDFAGDALKTDPVLLADEANSISMFASKRWIRVQGGDEITPAVLILLEAPTPDTPIVVVAGNLPKSAALVKLALERPDILALASYAAEAGDMARQVIEIGRGYGVQLELPLARVLAHACDNNSGLVRQEMEKFALYLEGTPQAPKALTQETYAALSADASEAHAQVIMDAALEGQMGVLTQEMQAGALEPVLLLNAALTRTQMLAKLRAAVENGTRAEQAIEAQRSIFWKDKPILTRQLRLWSSARIKQLHARLVRCRTEVMRNYSSSDIIVRAELVAIARAAARWR